MLAKYLKMDLHLLLRVLMLIPCVWTLNWTLPRITKDPGLKGELYYGYMTSGFRIKPFDIECEAEGTPVPTFNWMKDGEAFDSTENPDISMQRGKGTLRFHSPYDEEHEGTYQCFTSNEYGTASSLPVIVKMLPIRSLRSGDNITVTVFEGDSVKFPCNSSPFRKFSNHSTIWRKSMEIYAPGHQIDSPRMTVDPEGSLQISNVEMDDQAYYICSSEIELTHSLNRLQIASLAVKKKDEPLKEIEPLVGFVSDNVNLIVKGETLELWCIYNGRPIPKVEWKFHRNNSLVDLPLERVKYQNYGKTLFIPNINYQDQGQYTCEVSNGIGVMRSNTFKVTLHEKPYFKTEPHWEINESGDRLDIKCIGDGKPSPTTTYTHNSKPIKEAPSKRRYQIKHDGLTINNVHPTDVGNYGCLLVNEHGRFYQELYVNSIALPPNIRNLTSEMAVEEGDDVTITCEATGIPKPRISWKLNQQAVQSGRLELTDSGLLTIKHASLNDTGKYQCEASNIHGESLHEIILTVKRINMIVQTGHTATLKCKTVTHSDVSTNVKWLANGQEIMLNNGQNPRFIQYSKSSLIIVDVNKADEGNYTCVVSTELEETHQTILLTILAVPEPPIIISTICNFGEAIVQWQEPYGFGATPISNYIVQFKTNHETDKWIYSSANISATATSYKVPLDSYTTYNFRVIAQSKDWQSLPSECSVSCTTPPGRPSRNPHNVRSEGTTPDNIVIRWEPMSPKEHNGPGLGYEITFQKKYVGGCSEDYSDPWDDPYSRDPEIHQYYIYDWQQDSYIITGLKAFQCVQFKVEASNDLGSSVQPAVMLHGFSGEGVPYRKPRDLQLIDLHNKTAASISFLQVYRDHVNGIPKGYKVLKWTDGRDNETFEILLDEHNKNEHPLTISVPNLAPNTINYVAVSVFNSVYDGPLSDPLIIDASLAKPEPVESLQSFPMGPDSLLVKWKDPFYSVAHGYYIVYQEMSNLTDFSFPIMNVSVYCRPISGVKLTSLKHNTKYQITVIAKSKAGVGEAAVIEGETRTPAEDQFPAKPYFIWGITYTWEGKPAIKITWIPNTNLFFGSYFVVSYIKLGESFSKKIEEHEGMSVTIDKDVEFGQAYRVVILAGNYQYKMSSDEELITLPDMN